MAFLDVVNFDYVFQDLQINPSMEVFQDIVGEPSDVPALQTYDSIGGGYDPDFTIFPLVLQPEILAYDPDGILASPEQEIRINKDLANMHWTIIEDGQQDLEITNSNPDYQVETTGENKGRLTVMRNIRPNHPLTFIFYAEYLDTRTNKVRRIDMMPFPVRCDLEIQQAELKLDTAAYHLYNPLEPPVETVHASVFSGNKSVPNAQCRCKWQIRDNNAWADAGSRVDLSFVDVSEDTMSAEIHMDYMGKGTTIRCLGFVGEDAAEVESKLANNEYFAERTFRIRRQLPSHQAKIGGIPKSIPRSQKEVFPRAMLNFQNFTCDDPTTEIKVTWKTARGKAPNDTSPTYATVAEGLNPTIKADKMSPIYGQMLRMEAEDRGDWKIMTDGAGNVLTDGDGKVLLIR